MVFHRFLSYMCSFMIPRRCPRIKPAPVYESVSYDDISRRPKDGLCCASGLPTRSSLNETVEGNEVCCVCLSRLMEWEDVRVLPCAHTFHRVCIDRWLEVCPRSCPLCRFSMDEEGGGRGGGTYHHTVGVITDEMVIWFSSFHA